MADTTYRPIENGFETSLTQDLNTTDLTFYCVAVPTATIPSGKFLAVVLSAGTISQEIVKVESIDTVNKTMTVATGGRAQNIGNAYAGTAQEHTVGSRVIISDDYITLADYGDAIDSKVNLSGDTMTGLLQFSGGDHAGIRLISLTTAQRLAITPANGDLVYDSDLGQIYQYIGGAWEAVDSGAPTPNGSTTVNGTWQGATVAEQGAATVTGSTGASLLVQNQFLVKTSSGAGDENKIAVLDANGQFDVGFIPQASLSLVTTGAVLMWFTATVPTGYLFCDGSTPSRATYPNLFDVLNPSLGTATMTIASPCVVTLTNHGLVIDDTIWFTTTGALPTGVSANTRYFVISTGLTTNEFQFSSTKGGSAIASSGTQSGVHSLKRTYAGLGNGSTTFDLPDMPGRVPVGRDTTQTEFNAIGETGGEKTHTLTTGEMPAHTHNSPYSSAAVQGGGGALGITVASGNATSSNGGGSAHNNLQPYTVLNFIIKT